MKVIIAGSRWITKYDWVCEAIGWFDTPITEVVSGGADGVDKLGELWAERMDIPVVRFEAKWYEHGKAAGPIRNQAMADYAEGLIAVWDGKSKGTADMIRRAKAKGLKIYVHKLVLTPAAP